MKDTELSPEWCLEDQGGEKIELEFVVDGDYTAKLDSQLLLYVG